MTRNLEGSPRQLPTAEEIARQEIERVNARLRHFRGVAAHVMQDALEIWREIWEACQDPRSWEEILDGVPEPAARTPAGGWAEFHAKLHHLGTCLDYAKRLCEGSLERGGPREREVETWPKDSESSARTSNSKPARCSLTKKS